MNFSIISTLIIFTMSIVSSSKLPSTFEKDLVITVSRGALMSPGSVALTVTYTYDSCVHKNGHSFKLDQKDREEIIKNIQLLNGLKSGLGISREQDGHSETIFINSKKSGLMMFDVLNSGEVG